MTRQEAIKYLIKVRDNCDYDRCPDFNPYEDRILHGRCTCDICEEAVDIAIKALAKEWKKEYDHSKSAWENIKEGNGISKEIPKESSEDLMSRQEAIEILTASDYFWLRPSENEAEALNIAIEALKQLSLPKIIIKQGEQEPREDLISRQDAIHALARSSVYAWSVEEDQIAHEWALKIISELPAKG